jgi:hypothetical protein
VKTQVQKSSKVTLKQARKVLEVVDAGLCSGLGQPKPGQMCVEAAVCYALGQPHGDNPKCVAPAVRSFKIALNDAAWSSNTARAKGMRRIAIAQLGTAGEIDEVAFAKALAEQTIRQIVPVALRAAAELHQDAMHKAALEAAAVRCEKEGSWAASWAASEAASWAASEAARAASWAASWAASEAASWAASEAARAASWAASEAARAARAASWAASEAARAASWAASWAASEAASWAASEAARAASWAASEAASDRVLSLAAEIGVQALRVVGAAGVALMDKILS